jgi:hypothetical protein
MRSSVRPAPYEAGRRRGRQLAVHGGERGRPGRRGVEVHADERARRVAVQPPPAVQFGPIQDEPIEVAMQRESAAAIGQNTQLDEDRYQVVRILVVAHPHRPQDPPVLIDGSRVMTPPASVDAYPHARHMFLQGAVGYGHRGRPRRQSQSAAEARVVEAGEVTQRQRSRSR